MSDDPNNSGNNTTPAPLPPQAVPQPAYAPVPVPPINQPASGGYVINPNGYITITTSPLNWYGVVIPTSEVVQIAPTEAKKSEGASCRKCRDFNEYAEPNQEDGTFVCYSCRRG